MATIPYLYPKGKGQGFLVRVANKNAGVNVDRFFRANQKQEAINFAKQIAKTIEKETGNFINRDQLGKKLGVSYGSIEKYKGSNNEVYKKINKDLNPELSTRLKFMIVSVDGNRDRALISNFVDNHFFSKYSREFRKHLRDIQPGVDLKFTTSSGEEVAIPIGISFFWPDFE